MALNISYAVLVLCLKLVWSLDVVKTRQKRFLDLPKGSAFTVTIAMTTFLPKDVLPNNIPNGFGHIVEYDFAYRFPGHLETKMAGRKPAIKKKKRPEMYIKPEQLYLFNEYPYHGVNKRRWKGDRGKNYVLKHIKGFISRQGYNGEACIRRLSCEANEHLRQGTSFLEDLILNFVPVVSKSICNSSYIDCPFSPLHVLMHSVPILDVVGL